MTCKTTSMAVNKAADTMNFVSNFFFITFEIIPIKNNISNIILVFLNADLVYNKVWGEIYD